MKTDSICAFIFNVCRNLFLHDSDHNKKGAKKKSEKSLKAHLKSRR
jgi:hypothetical protein